MNREQALLRARRHLSALVHYYEVLGWDRQADAADLERRRVDAEIDVLRQQVAA